MARTKILDLALCFVGGAIVGAFIISLFLCSSPANMANNIDYNSEQKIIQAITQERDSLKSKLDRLEVDVEVYDEDRPLKKWQFKNLLSDEEIFWKTECGRFVFRARME